MSDGIIYAWHCVNANGTTSRLFVPDIVGVRYAVDGEVVPCSNGLHASVNPLDALYYGGFGGRMKRVRLEGAVPHGDPVDKHAGRARTTLFELMPDQTSPVFRDFAFWCVEEIARPAAIDALRAAGLVLHHAFLESLPPVVDVESAKAFRAAAYSAYVGCRSEVINAAVRAAHATYSNYSGKIAAPDVVGVSSAAAYAAARHPGAPWGSYCDATGRIGEELTRRLLALAPVGYTEGVGE